MSVTSKSNSRAKSRSANITIKFFVAGIGVWVASQFWPHWQNHQDENPPKPDAPSITQPPLVPSPVPDVATSILGTDSSISEKPLQLILVDTMPGRTLAEGKATLGTDPRNPQTFGGGATLSNGARVEEILADRIVLRFKGRLHTLMVDRDAPARVAMNAAANDERKKKGYPILTPTLTEGTEGGATSIGGQRAGYVEREATSHESLSEVVRPVPVFENDKFAGFKLLAGRQSGRLAVLGLESGDIVRSVEGKYIESDLEWMQIEKALVRGKSIVIGIERNGALIPMTLDGAKIVDSGTPTSVGPPAIPQSL